MTRKHPRHESIKAHRARNRKRRARQIARRVKNAPKALAHLWPPQQGHRRAKFSAKPYDTPNEAHPGLWSEGIAR